jgi:ABC-type nitrate/sulfonate/bicarbonate transport system permease component
MSSVHSHAIDAARGSLFIRRVRAKITYTLGFALFLIVWQIAAMIVDARTFPTPVAVLSDFVVMTYDAPFIRSSLGTDSVLPHLFATTWRTVLGVVSGALTAIAVGLLFGWKEDLYHFFEVPIELLRSVPPLAYLPFLSLWFGPTNLAIFLLVFSGTFFMVIVNTITAIHNVDPIYSKFATTLGASRGQIYRTVVIPSILPELTGGIRVILVYSWGITIAGELLGVKAGIGQVLMVLTTFAAVAQILATTLWVSAAAIFFDRVYVHVDKRLIRWKDIEAQRAL